MATMRLKPTSYTIKRNPRDSVIQNVETIINQANPEDPVSSYLAMRAAYTGAPSSSDCPAVDLSFTIPSQLQGRTITAITLKARIISYNNESILGKCTVWINDSSGTSLTTAVVANQAAANTYMTTGGSNYSSVALTSAEVSSFMSSTPTPTIRLTSGYYNNVVYISGVVLDVEYTGEDHIAIGANNLKKATLGSQNLKKIFNGTTKLFHYKRLPKEYEELEYIQNLPFPQNYIDTGVAWSGSTRIVGEFSTPATGSNGTKLFVATQGDSSMPGFTYLYIDTSNQMVGSNVTVGSYTIGTNTVDVTYQTSTTSNIYITAWSDVYWACTFRYKNFKIYNGNTLLRNYIPCYRKSDGVGGLYDLVNGVFYSSNGSSAYLKGPEVEIELPAAYQQVESITAHGDVYFDTSYTCGTGTSCRIDYLDDNSEGSVWANYFYTPFYRFIRYSGTNFGTVEYRISGTNLGYSHLPASTYNTRHVFEFTKQQVLDENGSVLATHAQTTTDSWSADKHLILFRGYYYNDWDVYGCYTLYNFRVYENNVLTRNYIPCYRKSDNKIGLYDTVVGAFITSTGTGTLTKGNGVY